MADFLKNESQPILVNINNIEKPIHTMPSKTSKTFFESNVMTQKKSRTFGEVYLCNEETFGEFFRIQEFDTFNIEKFQGTEDKLFIFYQDETDQNRIAVIEK